MTMCACQITIPHYKKQGGLRTTALGDLWGSMDRIRMCSWIQRLAALGNDYSGALSFATEPRRHAWPCRLSRP